jgi:hypothetical protein
MSFVRLLGFGTLSCGCVVGRYLEFPARIEKMYVEEKGQACPHSTHRRHYVVTDPAATDTQPTS